MLILRTWGWGLGGSNKHLRYILKNKILAQFLTKSVYMFAFFLDLKAVHIVVYTIVRFNMWIHSMKLHYRYQCCCHSRSMGLM